MTRAAAPLSGVSSVCDDRPSGTRGGSRRGVALGVVLLILGALVALCCCRDTHESTTALSDAHPTGPVQLDEARHRVTPVAAATDRPQPLDERLHGTSPGTTGSVSGSETCAPEPAPLGVATTVRALGDVLPTLPVGGAAIQVTELVGRLSPPAPAGALPDPPAHLLCVMRT